MLTDSSSLRKITTAQIILTYPCIFTSYPSLYPYLQIKQIRPTNHYTLNNHVNNQIHEHKTKNKHLDKIALKHNPHSLWGIIAMLSNKKQPTQQNKSIQLKLKQPSLTWTKQKHLINSSQTSLHIA